MDVITNNDWELRLSTRSLKFKKKLFSRTTECNGRLAWKFARTMRFKFIQMKSLRSQMATP